MLALQVGDDLLVIPVGGAGRVERRQPVVPAATGRLADGLRGDPVE
jgi:hypothetical protein